MKKKLERIKSVDHFRKSFKGGATPRISRKSRKGRMIRLPVLYSLADQAKLKHLLSFKYEPVKKSAIFKASGMPDPVAEASGNISSSTYCIIPIAHHEALVRQSVSVINNIIPEPAVDVAQVHAKDTKADFITDFINKPKEIKEQIENEEISKELSIAQSWQESQDISCRSPQQSSYNYIWKESQDISKRYFSEDDVDEDQEIILNHVNENMMDSINVLQPPAVALIEKPIEPSISAAKIVKVSKGKGPRRLSDLFAVRFTKVCKLSIF